MLSWWDLVLLKVLRSCAQSLFRGKISSLRNIQVLPTPTSEAECIVGLHTAKPSEQLSVNHWMRVIISTYTTAFLKYSIAKTCKGMRSAQLWRYQSVSHDRNSISQSLIVDLQGTQGTLVVPVLLLGIFLAENLFALHSRIIIFLRSLTCFRGMQDHR